MKNIALESFQGKVYFSCEIVKLVRFERVLDFKHKPHITVVLPSL